MASGMRERSVVVNKSASGANELVAAVTGAIIRVTQVALVAAEAVTVTFKSATTAITGPMAWGANVPFIDRSAQQNRGLFATAPGEALNMDLGAAKAVGGYICVQIIPVTPSAL